MITVMTGIRRRLLIVEDEHLMRGLLQSNLTGLGFEVEAVESAIQAKKAVKSFDPDITIIDVHLKGSISGLHFGHYLAQEYPEIAQVYLTALEDVIRSGQDGLDVPPDAGFVSKHHIGGTADLVEVIEQVIRGKQNKQIMSIKSATDFDLLGERPRRAIELLAEGFSNRSISEALGVSEKTVEHYIDLGYKALGIEKSSDRNQRVEAALRLQRLMFTNAQETSLE
jgi:DNA-binding NarL/FixJ family response regulator